MGDNIKPRDLNNEEVSLKDIIIKLKYVFKYLLSKWVIILAVTAIGGVFGIINSVIKKTIYTADLSFALEEGKAGGGLSGALGLASQFGIDVGGSGVEGEFSGDNLLLLMKSRSMIQKTLLSDVIINGEKQTLAEYYITFNNLRESWKSKPGLQNVHFMPAADPSKFTLKQDSLLGVFYKLIISKNLDVNKIDKKLSIISLKVRSENEQFAKKFTEVLANVVSDFYVQTKTEKASKNVNILQQQTDSIRRVLNGDISGVATSLDANPNPNPSLQILRVSAQRQSVNVQANTAILSELVKNLAIAKMTLLQETPLIQIIDTPILPLEKERLSKFNGLIIGGLLGFFLITFILIITKIFKSVMA